MRARGHGKPRVSISVSSRWGWAPSAIEKMNMMWSKGEVRTMTLINVMKSGRAADYGRRMRRLLSAAALVLATASHVGAQSGQQTSTEPKPSVEIYGFAMLDIGHDFKQIDPNWFDTMRVTKLPSVEDQF